MIDNKYWINNFPYSEPREQQEKAINYILKEFKQGKKYAIIECGTGVGKSAIGYTLAKTLKTNATEKTKILTIKGEVKKPVEAPAAPTKPKSSVLEVK